MWNNPDRRQNSAGDALPTLLKVGPKQGQDSEEKDRGGEGVSAGEAKAVGRDQLMVRTGSQDGVLHGDYQAVAAEFEAGKPQSPATLVTPPADGEDNQGKGEKEDRVAEVGDHREEVGAQGRRGLQEPVAEAVESVDPAGVLPDTPKKDGKDQPAAGPH